jgi:hypothetical protein
MNDNETEILDALYVRSLLACLTPDEKAIMLAELEGPEDPNAPDVHPYVVAQIAHKLARRVNARRKCPKCRRTRNANWFGWDRWVDGQCLECETYAMRRKRIRRECEVLGVPVPKWRPGQPRKPRDSQPCPSLTAYRNGCRCDGCKEFVREYARTRRQAKPKPPRVPLEGYTGKHGRTGYEHGCRCQTCFDAKSARAKAFRARKKQERDAA